MISYWKTQWFKVLVGLGALGLYIYYLFQPAADESTLEGLNQNLENSFAVLCFFLTSMIWFVSSIVEYHSDCIKLLEKKAEKYDALVKKVDALQELLETERKYADHQNKKLESLIYVVEEMRKHD